MKRERIIPDFSGAFPEGNIECLYDFTRMILPEHAEKIRSYLPEVQQFYLACRDLDLEKEYDVVGIEAKLRGIDLLAIMDIMMRDRVNPINNLIVKGGLYFDHANKCVGYISAQGPQLFCNTINNPQTTERK